MKTFSLVVVVPFDSLVFAQGTIRLAWNLIAESRRRP